MPIAFSPNNAFPHLLMNRGGNVSSSAYILYNLIGWGKTNKGSKVDVFYLIFLYCCFRINELCLQILQGLLVFVLHIHFL